ncbi:hypothetical protein C7E12_22745, partial [Stenotrophomonas maltophilia]
MAGEGEVWGDKGGSAEGVAGTSCAMASVLSCARASRRISSRVAGEGEVWGDKGGSAEGVAGT